MNIPQTSGVSVTSLNLMPNLNVSMTLNVSTSLGRNKINRVAHSTAHFYPGATQSDSTVELPEAVLSTITGLPEPTPWVLTLQKPTKVLQLAVQRPIQAVLTVNNVQSTLPVTRLLIIDSPVDRIELVNLDTQTTAQVIVTYIT